jgi:hypothetical protein
MATCERIWQIQVLAGNLPFLVNSSTRQVGLFWKSAGLTRLADIHQPGLLGLARLANIRQPGLLGLARLTDIRQPSLLELARLAKA